jgi:hypothetical protein
MVEHPRLVEHLLGDDERPPGVAREQDPRRERGGGAEVQRRQGGRSLKSPNVTSRGERIGLDAHSGARYTLRQKLQTEAEQ